MTRSREDHVSFKGSTQVLDDESITAIIPLDELEARLEAAYAETWTDASDGGSALLYRPSRSEVTQDLMIPEVLFTGTPRFDGPALDEDEDTALLAEPELAPEPLGSPVRRGGKHRVPAPPHALKGRAALLALAAGATVAGAAVSTAPDEGPSTSQQPIAPAPGPEANAGRQAPLPPAQDMDQFTAGLAGGKARKDADDKRIIDSMRPKVIAPINGAILTSNFGTRWGAMHGGLDLAAPLGTPLFAAADGVVTDAGPASGFGIWIKIRLSDGTVLVYGHMYNVNVHAGQTVKAGDLISWVGSNGYSTGPHLHFEVHSPAGAKMDPQAWLAERGVNV
ncbi:M23 family metallopeptidase [Tsukamurella sp. NPDC003166]|uniref:M23 family metallopeptidase n=1 Tax=Tsukamurella sp. NPDC003166 TaxID=3154444 RepID=UPI0033A7F7A2